MATDESNASANEQEQDTSSQSAPAYGLMQTSPILLVDVLLYDLSITRNPERIADFTAIGGDLNADVAKPLIAGERMEVSLGLAIHLPNTQDPAWTMQFRLNGVFALDPSVSREVAEAFAATSVLPILWPYARELVMTLTTRMRVMPLIIPTVQLQPATLVPAPPPSESQGQKEHQATEHGGEAR